MTGRALPVHVGCSGWNYSSWRGAVYPPGMPASRWLARYAELFDTVEVNATFYRLIAREAVARWVAQTPAGFVFAVKASRYLTHVKRLSGIGQGLARFYERIEPLIEADRLGAVLWQLPESFRRDDARLAGALAALPAGRHAFEFRHPSWFAPEVYELLRERHAALVIGDHPDRPFQAHVLTASWSYVRFHYGAHGRNGNYSAGDLAAWAERLEPWRPRAELFLYFNNDWSAFAPRNASALRAQLERERQPSSETGR
jgi:uncharacterized protein YecE (DUF72 family)